MFILLQTLWEDSAVIVSMLSPLCVLIRLLKSTLDKRLHKLCDIVSINLRALILSPVFQYPENYFTFQSEYFQKNLLSFLSNLFEYHYHNSIDLKIFKNFLFISVR